MMLPYDNLLYNHCNKAFLLKHAVKLILSDTS